MVIVIGKWSDESLFSVVQRVSIASDGEQKVMSGDEDSLFAWWGLCVCCVVSFRIYRCCRSCSMCLPLLFVGLSWYQAVLLPLKSPPMIRFGSCVIGSKGGV